MWELAMNRFYLEAARFENSAARNYQSQAINCILYYIPKILGEAKCAEFVDWYSQTPKDLLTKK
jgi:hypothetical protein